MAANHLFLNQSDTHVIVPDYVAGPHPLQCSAETSISHIPGWKRQRGVRLWPDSTLTAPGSVTLEDPRSQVLPLTFFSAHTRPFDNRYDAIQEGKFFLSTAAAMAAAVRQFRCSLYKL